MGKAGVKANRSPLRPRAPAQRARAPAAPVPRVERASSPGDSLLHELQVHQIELEMQNEELIRSQAALEASHKLFADLYEFAPVGYLTLTRDGGITAVNRMAAGLLGLDAGSLTGRNFAACVAPADAARWERIFSDAKAHADLCASDLRLLRVDGRPMTVRLSCLFRGAASAPVRVTLFDITETRHAEDELRIAALAFETDSGILVTDADAVIIRVNAAFTRLTGYSASEAAGSTPALLKSRRHDRAFFDEMWQTLKARGAWRGEIWNRTKNGADFPSLMVISAVRAADGAVAHYIGTFTDITREKDAEAQIHRLAYYDSLTHLPNRQLLRDRIGHALVGARRSRQHGAVLFLDLDHFKTLNDTRGHESGDALLIEIAQRIVSSVRGNDTVARMGGDEFVILLDALTTEATEAAIQAAQIAEKIRRAVAQPYRLEHGDFPCTVSIGVAIFGGTEDSVDALLKDADLAMYQAKSAGRNTLRLVDPALQAAVERRGPLDLFPRP
jgi:diguanylate cyclase (GGDEF)-like protein/PAS domain S-box-containing protein